MKNVIKTLGKKQRDILRESLSTMKQGWQQPGELPEEIISDEDTEQKQAKKPEPQPSPIIPQSVPKPKIVCQTLYANTVATRSQAALQPYMEINNEVLEAIRVENESVRSSKKPETGKRQEPSAFCRPFSQLAPKKPLMEIPKAQEEEKKETKPGLEGLLERLQKLDKGKIEKLAEILDIIEKEESPGSKIAKPIVAELQSAKEDKGVAPNIMPVINPAPAVPTPLAAKEEKPVQPATKTYPKKNELVFRILSTWGHPHVAGLTEIELYDTQGKKIVAPLSARNLGPGPTQPTMKLTNGKIYVNDEKYMWIAYLPPLPKLVELVFTLPIGFSAVGGMVVWNYNKNSLDSVKGVRDAEVLLNGSVAWSGTIKRGNGRTNEDYSSEIALSDSPEVFKDKPRVPGSTSGGEEEPPHEIPMPKELLKMKQEIEQNSSRPISVPAWLQGEETKMGRGPIESVTTKATDNSQRSGVYQKEETVGRKPRALFSERPSKFQAKKGFGTKLTESKSTTNRGRRQVQNAGPQQRDLSMERHIDSLMYFEASKPQRLLRGKVDAKKQVHSVDPIKETPKLESHKPLPSQFKENPISAIPKPAIKPPADIPSTKEKDILDAFIQGHELGGKKPEPKTSFESLKTLYETSTAFTIPELPKGKVLTFDILSTWQDPHYVGLAGIEIFTAEGIPLKVHPSKIVAEPKDINILPEYGSDPRTVDKLVDGTYFTRDDLHVWLAPYNPGKRHYITIDLGITTTISMIRIWNYNKSRIHSERGVKDLLIALDDNQIFMGEVKKAPGTVSDLQQCCEVLLFTEKAEVVSQIAAHDWVETVEIEESCVESHVVEERPPTATKRYTPEEIVQIQRVIAQKDALERPLTTAMTGKQLSIKEQLAAKDKELALLQLEEEKKKLVAQNVNKQAMAYGSSLIINILETWGDMFYVGLTGLEIYNDKSEKIALDISHITANPKDLNSIPGYSGDYRTIDKLIDGVNSTVDDKHMWLIPYNKGQSHKIMITLPKAMYISALKFFNYNKSVEDTNRGAKIVTISVDDKLVTPKRGVVIRKAPGTAHYDFGYTVKVPYTQGWEVNEISAYNKYQTIPLSIFQEYITPSLPTGFTFEFIFYSTYGDIHYIGLNGLEMYDLLGRPMLQNRNYHIPYKLDAVPSSVNVLSGLEGDIRTLDKLVDGYNDTLDDRHMWLTPMRNTKLYAVTNREVAKTPNVVTVSFNGQIALGGVRIWNYAKTPSRGAQEFAIFCDNRIIYRVFLQVQHQLIGNYKAST
eukprot:TRINITY_DN372_c0_g1_i1.p1 TRINITY_DN372_c0_g1~~TRINITY_DN372_c0_g1_i1.p1  ORF type:complete len:1264 (-),score=175.40 TRINITY_DN372_c0_g1_i1:6620-10411(-)